jgi:amylosucrase
MLTAAQQGVAVLAYIKNRLIAEQGDASLLQDPFFLANLDYNFLALFEIYSSMSMSFPIRPVLDSTGLTFTPLTAIYGHRHDCLESLVLLVRSLAECWTDRPEWLKHIDRSRLLKSTWYTSNKMVSSQQPCASDSVQTLTRVSVGYRLAEPGKQALGKENHSKLNALSHSYVDLYARNLRGLRERIPYFRELGLTYLHIMPPYKQPGKTTEEGVLATSYRQIDEKLGSMYELSDLAKELSEYVLRKSLLSRAGADPFSIAQELESVSLWT